jgi:heme oxygenase
MAFNDLETQKIKNAVETIFMAKRPPVSIRKELDFGYRLENQSIVLFEVRQHWQDKTKTLENEVAKLTYVKTQKAWKLHWMRQDLKWHSYEPYDSNSSLEKVLNAVMQNKLGCFFG